MFLCTMYVISSFIFVISSYYLRIVFVGSTELHLVATPKSLITGIHSISRSLLYCSFIFLFPAATGTYFLDKKSLFLGLLLSLGITASP